MHEAREDGLGLLEGDSTGGRPALLHELAERPEREGSREGDVLILIFGVASEDVDDLGPPAKWDLDIADRGYELR